MAFSPYNDKDSFSEYLRRVRMKQMPLHQLNELSFPFRIEHTNPFVNENFSHHLYAALEHHSPLPEVVVVCIGTDRSTGDSLGPLVGTFLEKHTPDNIYIYGTLDQPVHAMNLADTLEHINANHPEAVVVAVDACLGQSRSVGYIQVGLGPIKPGAGVNKNLPEVGQVHITGIVNVSGFMEYFVLQNTRLNIVMNMAEIISTSILSAVHRYTVKDHVN